MIIDPQERTIISSLGWADRNCLWCLDIASERPRTVEIGNAKYLSLRAGSKGYFAVVHHFDAGRLEITAHTFADPGAILSRCSIDGEVRRIEGDLAIWNDLPRYYVAYLVQPAWSDFALIEVDAATGLSLQTFEWYDQRYDKGYQGITGVIEIPGSNAVIVSVQRDSRPVLFDPVTRRKIGEIALTGKHGNPTLHFRRTAHELWADDYDTVLKLEPESWRILNQQGLQGPGAGGTAQFIGQYAFDVNERICAVARPFSGDVVGLDPEELRVYCRAEVGAQPLVTSVLRDNRIFARDWKTGALLKGVLRPV